MKNLKKLHEKMKASIKNMEQALEDSYPKESEIEFTIRYKQKSISSGVVIGYWREYVRVRMNSATEKVVDVFYANII